MSSSLSQAKALHRRKAMNQVYLPDELIFNILSYLPSKSLLRFLCVCKSWNSLITYDPKFRNLHACNANTRRPRCLGFQHLYRKSLLRGEAFGSDISAFVNLIDSCNGLVCTSYPMIYQSRCHNSSVIIIVCLWNPSINKHKTIPFSFPSHYESNLLIGFGFVNTNTTKWKGNGSSSNNHTNKGRDCKVVIICKDQVKKDHVYVYSLSTDSWTRGQSQPNALTRSNYLYQGATFNGAYHWTCIMAGRVKLLCFDLDDEELRNVDVPAEPCNVCKYGQACQAFICRGMLSLWDSCSHRLSATGSGCNNLWVMKEYGDSSSWTVLINLATNSLERVSLKVRFLFDTAADNGGSLYTHSGCVLVAHEFESRKLEECETSEVMKLVPYEESLTLLDANEFG